ncbi:MAG: GNAT family N-acetyltransferase [Lachnospiraceae bacterium]|nr:GNAT family N-acetyltransferase [Lachnospiraceae bacterium]
MNIREIDKNEVNKLRSCLIQLSEHHNQISTHFNGFYPSKPYEDTLNAFYTSLQSGQSYIAVIENDEKVVGFCKVDIVQGKGKLDYLVVLREYRKKGYGQMLMDWAMDAFSKNNISHIEVKVVDGNDAIHLYEKYGFKMNAHLLWYCEG